MSSARSSALAMIRSNQRRSTAARCLPVSARQAGQAALAASMARRVSSRTELGDTGQHFATGGIDDGETAGGGQPGAIDEGLVAQQAGVAQLHRLCSFFPAANEKSNRTSSGRMTP